MKDLLYAFQLNRWDLLAIFFEWMVLEFAVIAVFTSWDKKGIAYKEHEGIYCSQRADSLCELMSFSHQFHCHIKERQKGIFTLILKTDIF